MPLGRISELFSEQESEGKTTLILHAAAQCQKAGGVVVFLDSEAALDRPRASRIGLDLSQVITTGPASVEDGFEFIDALVKNISEDKELHGVPTLIIWDTIAAAPTRGEKAGDPFAGGMTEKPRIISRALRNYVAEFFKYRVHLCLVNQSITNIDNKNPYGPKYITPGGKAIKFFSTLRIKCKRTGYVGESRSLGVGDQRTGIKVTVDAVKNKLATPSQRTESVLIGATGYNETLSLAEFLLTNKVNECIEQKGAWIYLPGDRKCYWKNLEQLVESNPDILAKWQAEARKRISVPPNRKLNAQGWYERDVALPLEEDEETEEAPAE